MSRGGPEGEGEASGRRAGGVPRPAEAGAADIGGAAHEPLWYTRYGMPPPLDGLRALDLTDALGYLCGRLLVDLGVDVVKVEPPGGDAGRRLEPRHRDANGVEHGLYWHATNAGKRSVTLDVAHPGARR